MVVVYKEKTDKQNLLDDEEVEHVVEELHLVGVLVGCKLMKHKKVESCEKSEYEFFYIQQIKYLRISQVSRENASSARWRPLNGGSGPRKLEKSEPSLAVATELSLRPIDAPRVESNFPFDLNAFENPPGPDIVKS